MYVCRKNLVVIERICIFVVGIAATILLFYFTIIYIGLIFSLGLSAVENTPLNFFLDNEKKGYIFAIVSKKEGERYECNDRDEWADNKFAVQFV